MLRDSKVGWISVLSNDPKSAWASVNDFYKDVLHGSRGAIVRITSRVWGKLLRYEPLPKKGDGIAFYHASRAEFPRKDPFDRRPRISLVGRLNNIEYKGREVRRLDFSFRRGVAEALRSDPIVRDETTQHIFERCGISSGRIASYYFADGESWVQLLGLVRERLARARPRTGRQTLASTRKAKWPPEEIVRMLELHLSESPEDVDTSEQVRELLARIGQGPFSQNVRANYGSRCCFPDCDVEESEFLVGSHIARWADAPELRGRVSNGLCLCLMHDRAFESGLFTITSGLRVLASAAANTRAWCRTFILPFNSRRIRPGRVAPSQKALRRHWARTGIKTASGRS